MKRDRGCINNIPTDLLRTFITVIDQGSFTQAARTLGVSQPSVSAHIKRLQATLGSKLFDRSRRGLKLTAKGEAIVTHARHLLSINDRILDVAKPNACGRTIHLGVPPDFLGLTLPALLADLRERWPDLRFAIQTGGLDKHLNELREGLLDIVVGMSLSEPSLGVRHHWTERAVWVRGPLTQIDWRRQRIPLVSLSENCVYYRAAVSALQREDLDSELVLVGPTLISLASAVRAGLGIMALPRSRVSSPDVTMWDDAPLPLLPDFIWGVYLREGGEREVLEDLADSIAAEMHERTIAAARPRSKPSPKSVVTGAGRVAVS